MSEAKFGTDLSADSRISFRSCRRRNRPRLRRARRGRLLTERHNVQLRTFPADVVAAARRQAAEVLAELAARGEMARKVHDSYAAFRTRTAAWSRVSIKAVLEAR
jgi:TRAP-type mannitol/chloroaromatic compound transport system substrate-binding protein